ncbi:MAG: ClpXP protease specificity-enhancing factor [Gammaproteobacteria bacterium]|nr:ClpXP protease specificity-enhancing factor [Gammaproteobacteria bacterium]
MSRSRRSYLIRAIYDWAMDSGLTPHLLVAVDQPGVEVPKAYVKEDRIALNVSPMAVQGFDPLVEPLLFSARFGGAPFELQIPTGAVLAIYAAENGEGIAFGEPEASPSASPDEPGGGVPRPRRPKLRVVK